LNKPVSHSGFTLMELIVVLVIITVFLVFAIPGFSRKIFRDDKDITLNWIVLNAGKLKKDARLQGKDLFMCINTDTNTISIRQTPQGPDSDDTDVISEFVVPEDVTLDGVEFNRPGKADNDSCVQFYKKGYSDHAIIHLTNTDGTAFSCLIQPFLHKAMVYESHLQF